ncbi:uncharacterized protein G2W53_042634 [Senna tora]|uniref:Uncharacterized protein n=1 Tax=Senna tora TaxID=362788 RepID=A0A834VZ50_9FABA|nr:uncharacterized protein G2W53_042634 [Senna tora]
MLSSLRTNPSSLSFPFLFGVFSLPYCLRPGRAVAFVERAAAIASVRRDIEIKVVTKVVLIRVVHVDGDGDGGVGSWGTWDELLLGGAVLRHGTRDWDVVAAELRARTILSTLSPPRCVKPSMKTCNNVTLVLEEKSGRAEESLRTIGKIQSVRISQGRQKDEKERDDCDDAHNINESGGVQVVRVEQKLLERVESSTKETSSKDGLSAGSFTHETTRTKWSPCEQDMEDTKPEASHSCDDDEYEEKVSNLVIDRRQVWETVSFLLDSSSTGDVAVLSGCKENSTTNIINCAVEDQDQSRSFKKEGVEFLMQILDSVLENKVASAFRRRLDSQKRGRDLLLLTNNALVFYSKTTREYKSALLLRDHVTKKLRSSILPTQQHNGSVIKVAAAHNNNASVKPRSVRPGNRKIVAAKVDGGGSINSASRKSGGKVNSNNSPSPSPLSLPLPLQESLALKKKGIGRPKRVGRGSAGQVPVMGVKGKRRVRAK